MKEILPLFIMVDACGWEIIRNDPFANGFAPHRHRLEAVFGYSSACVPSILSGRWPAEHRNWCYFVYDPANSPFRMLRPLQWLPTALTGRRIVRRMLTKLVKRSLNFRGYFDLYNIYLYVVLTLIIIEYYMVSFGVVTSISHIILFVVAFGDIMLVVG